MGSSHLPGMLCIAHTESWQLLMCFNYQHWLHGQGKLPRSCTCDHQPKATFGLIHPSVTALHRADVHGCAVLEPTPVSLWLQVGEVRENRTTFLRMHPLPVKEESFWHSKRFEKVWAPHNPSHDQSQLFWVSTSTRLKSGLLSNPAHVPQ